MKRWTTTASSGTVASMRIKLLLAAGSVLVLALTSCAAPDALTYQDVVDLPHQEQIHVMQGASPENMAAIYQAHLAHVAELPSVTPEERAALARARALVTPEWYSSDAPGERMRADQAEAERLVRGLSPATMRAVATIGAE